MGLFNWRLKALLSRILLFLAVSAVVLLFAGAVCEAWLERRLTTRYQPPGRMVDLGTHRLHLYCEGEGDQPVLLEAGSGLAYINWHQVQTGLSRVTITCSYDRSGLGWSDTGPERASAKQAVDELARLLDLSGIQGPWIVVGHSLGGLYAQQLLNVHPEKVAGLVLVDSAHDGQGVEKLPHFEELYSPDLSDRLLTLLSVAGAHRLFLPQVPESDPTWLGRQLHATAKHVRRAAEEWWAIPSSSEQVGQARTDWADTPLVVLQAGTEGWQLESDAERKSADRIWTAQQKELAGRSSRGKHRVIEESGHGIPWEAPQVVIAEVESIMQEIRQP